MTTSFLRPDLANGFKFIRPSVARNGIAETLNEYAEQALRELNARLAKGFPAEAADLDAEAQRLEAEAAEYTKLADVQVKSAADMKRSADLSFQAREAAEDEATRKSEALEQARRSSRKDGDIRQLAEELDRSRKAAAAAKQIADGHTEEARAAQASAEQAALASLTARQQAEAARALARAGAEELRTVLTYPLYSLEPEPTLLAYNPSGPTLADHLDRKGLTKKRDAVKARIAGDLKALNTNQRLILSRDLVVDYLFARAAIVDGFDEPASIYRRITETSKGYKLVYDFVAERSLALLRKEKQLNISKATLRQMSGELIQSPVSLQQETFGAKLSSLVEQFVYAKDEQALLAKAQADLGLVIPARHTATLVDYIRRTNETSAKINPQNVSYFVSIALADLQKQETAILPSVTAGPVTTDDYSVSYYNDLTQALEFDRASVQAAAQMFLTMVWGDELGIFEVVNRIAMQSGQHQPIRLEVRSKELAADLRMYALDEEFRDLKTGQVSRRISPAERQMFYRQLFGYGDSQTPDSSQVNTDFRRLWAVLMTEVVKYIGKVEENSQGYQGVSTQKIYQAVEDIQYNLSAYCTGLPKIAAPTMHAELDFVIQRLLDSQDVKSQLARRGTPTFWRVVEEVRGMHDFTPLRNKGMFGHKILSTIAKATPALLEDQQSLTEFVSTVEAYIVAEDQLVDVQQQPPPIGQFPGFFGFDAPGMPNLPGMPNIPGLPFGGNGASGSNGANGHAPTDEWNF